MLRYEHMSEKTITIIGKNELVFVEPPVKDIKRIIAEMRKTKKYSAEFLKSMKQGLEESETFTS